MIKIMCEKQNQFFLITIKNKVVKYWDKLEGKIWNGALQYLPPDPSAIKKIEMSRNKIPPWYKELLKVTTEELQEFNNAKDDNELKDIVIRDIKKNMCKVIDIKIE